MLGRLLWLQLLAAAAGDRAPTFHVPVLVGTAGDICRHGAWAVESFSVPLSIFHQ